MLNWPQMDSTAEERSYFKHWTPPPLIQLLTSFFGPFCVFLALQAGTQYSNTKNWSLQPQGWDNGSYGAAVVIMFSMPHVPANLPRHIFLGQYISALIAFAYGYALPAANVHFLRTSLAVATATLLMKALGISYPPGAATAYILSQQPLTEWSVGKMFFYLIFTLTIANCFLLVFGYILNKTVAHQGYPSVWL